MNTHPSFDPEENAILSKLVPEGAEPGTPAGDVPDPEAPDPAADSAASAAAPEPTPAPTAAPADPAAAQAPAPSPEPTPAPTPEPTDAGSGNVKAALRASRQQERRLRNELDRLTQENRALKEGTAPESTDLTDEDLAELKENYPAQYKLAMKQRELDEHMRAQRQPSQGSEGFAPPLAPPEVQELIDQVPDLQAWQHDEQAQDKFTRAVEYDTALQADPDWKHKPVLERFAEAARRTKAAFGVPATTPAAAPAASRTDPAKALADAQVEGPKTIGDFRGGGPANATALDFNRMSDEAIMASLKPED